jgi:hypothetical protein
MPVSVKGKGYVIQSINRNPSTLNDTGFLTVQPKTISQIVPSSREDNDKDYNL